MGAVDAFAWVQGAGKVRKCTLWPGERLMCRGPGGVLWGGRGCVAARPGIFKGPLGGIVTPHLMGRPPCHPFPAQLNAALPQIDGQLVGAACGWRSQAAIPRRSDAAYDPCCPGLPSSDCLEDFNAT